MGCRAPAPADPAGETAGETAAPAALDSDAGTQRPVRGLLFSGQLPENVLLVSIDTLRRDALGAFSGAADTPRLDAWLEGALVLEHHRSCSDWTLPSMLCALTGVYNEHQSRYPTWESPVPDDALTLAEVLRGRGWRARAVAAHYAYSPEQNLGQGYHRVEYNAHWDAEEVTRRALSAAETLAQVGQPWLLHAHYIDPHVPYVTPAEYLEGYQPPPLPYDPADPGAMQEVERAWRQGALSESEMQAVLAHLNETYQAELRYLDEQLGRLLDGLGERGALDDTLVVFMSDHGEQFFEHGAYEHGESLFAEETLALAAFSAPGLAPGRFSAPTSHVDLLPTVLAALGEAPLEGISGQALGTFEAARPVFSSMVSEHEIMQSVEIGDDRLVVDWAGRVMRFDLATDPGEHVDLYVEGDPSLEAHWAALAPMTEALEAVIGETKATER